MNKYRIKTEKELIGEFGTTWNRDLCASWNSPDMDYLFGMELKLDLVEKYLDENGIFCTNVIYLLRKKSYNHNVWSIKTSLLKVTKIVDYNQKRILVYD